MAYVGVQQSTVARVSSIVCRRTAERIPPPGIASDPIRVAASNAVQNPRKGPNENAKKMWSCRRDTGGLVDAVPIPEHPVPALRVSSHVKGCPEVPLVWQNRV